MLERTAGCLESGSLRRLLPASNKTVKSRRTLHSSFWSHGASDLEMSPLWAALMRIATPADQQEAQQQRPAVLGQSGMLLDFLYPAGTLNFLRQYSGWGVDRAGARLARSGLERLGHRQYTSYAKDTTSNAPTGSPTDAAVLVKEDTEIISMDTFYKKLGLTKDYDYEEAWRQYSLLEEDEKQRPLRKQLMRYLSASERLIDAERTVKLFDGLEVERRESLQYRYTIRAYLKMRDLAGAMSLYTTALENSLETEDQPAGSQELLAYLAKSSSWSRAFAVWKDCKALMIRGQSGRGYDMMFEVLDLDPTIGSQAIELTAYVNRRIESASSDAGASKDTAELVDFAYEVVRRALLNTKTFNAARFQSLLSILQDWNRISAGLFGKLVFMLTRLNETKLAIKSYRRVRLSKINFTQPTLHTLLRVCCEYHSILGMQQVLDDFFQIYKRPSRTAYRMCMSEFAAQGDAQTVHALFDQLRIQDGVSSLDNAGEIAPVLHVHAKRGEVAEVIKYFNQIQEVYGLQPNLVCWNILINAHGKVHDVDRAYDCFEQLLNDDTLQPDDYTFGTLMGICTARGDVDRVIGLYMYAQEKQVPISAAMLDCLVLVHVQAADLQKAETICDDGLKLQLKGSRTRMWNYLITGHALNRDLFNVNRVLQRMSEAGVEYDQYTYSALMQSLAMVKQPDRAYAILTDVMPPAGIQATNFHYAVLMGGYIANGEVEKVFKLHRRMNKRNVRSSASTKLLELKATVIEDEKILEDGTSQEKASRALAMFRDAMASFDPQYVSDTAKKGAGGLPLDVAYTTMFHRYMIYVLGQYGEFSTVDELFEGYKNLLPASREGKLPLGMLWTIMEAKLKEGDHDTIQKFWEISLATAKELGRPIESATGVLPEDHILQREPQLVVPARQLDLARHLGLYMQSLHVQRETNEMIATVEGLLAEGFALDNQNWNTYITFLATRHRYQLGFRLCETYLMDNWTGWNRIRWTLPKRNRLSIELRALRKRPLHFRAKYITILHLARGYLELQSMAAESPHSDALLRLLETECPRVVRAITTMQRVDDHLERTVLRGY